jgi:hypothetical protein
MTLRTVVMRKKRKKPIEFKKGKLHRELGVPEGKPIPPGKKQAALSGQYGEANRRRAIFAFRGALKAGRETLARRRKR